jgi:hypothetical protein
MALSIQEPLESSYARWVSGLVFISVVLALFTILLSVSDGTVGKALPVAVASFVVAVVSRVVAQTTGAHRGAANAALVVAFIALGSGLQSAILGTGQLTSS